MKRQPSTTKIYDWDTWVELCAAEHVNPYDTQDISVADHDHDLTERTAVYAGKYPVREDGDNFIRCGTCGDITRQRDTELGICPECRGEEGKNKKKQSGATKGAAVKDARTEENKKARSLGRTGHGYQLSLGL
jgi:hypothetical protein